MGGVFRGDCLSDEDLRDSPSGGATRSTSDCGEGKAEPSDGSEPRPSNKPLRPAEQQSPRGSRRNCLDRSLHTGASRSTRSVEDILAEQLPAAPERDAGVATTGERHATPCGLPLPPARCPPNDG